MKIKNLACLATVILCSGTAFAQASPAVVRSLRVNSAEAITLQGQPYGIGSLEQAVCTQRYSSFFGQVIAVSDFQVSAEAVFAGQPISLYPTGFSGKFISDGARNEQTGLQVLNLSVAGGNWVVHAIYPSDPSDVVGHSYACMLIAS